MTHEELETLMVREVDGLLSAVERERLMRHAVDHPEVLVELERHRALRALTDGWVDRLVLDLEPPRTPRLVVAGVAALLAGALCTGGTLLWAVWSDPEVPRTLALGLSLLLVGLGLVLAGLAVQRLRRPADPYREVTR